jgi:SAM-dependent methyltransferase
MRQLLRRVLKRAMPVLPSVQAYRLWAAAYPPHAHNPLMQLEQDAMLQLMPDMRGKWVLDLACGTGRYGLIALEQGAAGVVGVDNSPDMLQPGGAALISDFHPFQAMNGAQRAFTDGNGKQYAVEHHVHLYSTYHAAAQQSGLVITNIAEPVYKGAAPAVLVLRLEKSDRTAS